MNCNNDSGTNKLLRACGKGDPYAQQELWNRHRAQLRRMVLARMDRRLNARVDPSDVIQEAIVEANRRLDEYLQKGECAFYPWLRQIAWEQLVQLHRRHIMAEKRTVCRETRRETALPDHSAIQLGEYLIAPETSASNRLLRAEILERTRQALDQLSAHEREVIVLRNLEQLSFKDVAAVLRITVAAAQSRYRRAVERIHALLTEN